MTSTLYDNYKKLELSGTINLMNSGIYVMLVSGNYNPYGAGTYASHTVTGDIGLSTEVVDPLGGYTRGGKALSNKSVGVGSPASSHVGYFDAADVVWTTTTITASGAVVYQSGATPATSYLIAWVDFGANYTSSNGSFTISWNTAGIVNLA